MYSFKTSDVKFELLFGQCFENDYKMGNQYNTVIYINIVSHGYSGKSEWTIDFYEFQQFAYQFNKLYADLKGELQLEDKEYGSRLNVKCDNTGKFLFTGKLISNTFQKLEFNFSVDQTFLNDFIKKLFNDYGKNFSLKK
ncbi:MAG: hypothetical protein LBR37_04480 [Erysipelotrichaceae bacterium]|jgi:hypothetical protein|nr:hypothetical protein [Erysipelotrichaceae bacterium]